MVDVVICGGFSPGARVLRAAIRNVCHDRDVCVVTLTPALAGIKSQVEDLKGLDPESTLIIDGCEGGCAIQAMGMLGLKGKRAMILKKYPSVNEKNIADAEDKISSFLEGRS